MKRSVSRNANSCHLNLIKESTLNETSASRRPGPKWLLKRPVSERLGGGNWRSWSEGKASIKTRLSSSLQCQFGRIGKKMSKETSGEIVWRDNWCFELDFAAIPFFVSSTFFGTFSLWLCVERQCKNVTTYDVSFLRTMYIYSKFWPPASFCPNKLILAWIICAESPVQLWPICLKSASIVDSFRIRICWCFVVTRNKKRPVALSNTSGAALSRKEKSDWKMLIIVLAWVSEFHLIASNSTFPTARYTERKLFSNREDGGGKAQFD